MKNFVKSFHFNSHTKLEELPIKLTNAINNFADDNNCEPVSISTSFYSAYDHHAIATVIFSTLDPTVIAS